MNKFTNSRDPLRAGPATAPSVPPAVAGFKSIGQATMGVLGSVVGAVLHRQNRIRDRVHRCIQSQLPNVRNRDLIDAASFFEDFGCDALDKMNVALKVEEEFDISVGDDDLEAFQTVRDLCSLVERKTREKAMAEERA